MEVNQENHQKKTAADAVNEQNKEPYIRERIMPKRDWKHYLLTGGLVIVAAAVMGISVGVGITVASPLLKQLLVNNETGKETEPRVTTEAETTEEETTTEEEETTESETEDETAESGENGETAGLNREQVEEIVDQVLNRQSFDRDDLGAISNAVKAIYAETNGDFLPINVTVDGAFGAEQTTVYGLVIQTGGTYVSMLAMSSQIPNGGSMTTQIGENAYPTQITSQDTVTGLTLLSADLSGMEVEELESISAALIGSAENLVPGDIVIAAGNPLGFAGSDAIGMVTGVEEDQTFADMTSSRIYTDIDCGTGTSTSGGFLFDLQGNVVGVIVPQTGADGQLQAYGVDALKTIVEYLLSGSDIAYLGIMGQDISAATAESNSLVEGIYIRNVIADTPAYQAGLQVGDIIVAVDKQDVTSLETLDDLLQQTENGGTLTLGVMRWSRDAYTRIDLNVTVSGRIRNW